MTSSSPPATVEVVELIGNPRLGSRTRTKVFLDQYGQDELASTVAVGVAIAAALADAAVGP